MTTTYRAGRTALGALFLAWFGAVVVRYQQVQSFEGLAAVALFAAWVVVFTLACLGAGLPVWRVCRGELKVFADWLIAAGLGCVVLVTAALLFSLAGLFRPLPLTGVGLIAALGGSIAVWRQRRQLRRPPGWPRPWLLAAIIVGIAVGTALVTATASPFYDQFHYHLGFPYQWLRSGHIEVFPRHAYSYLPAAMGTLFAYPLNFLGTWSAQAIHWWMGALTVLATGALADQLAGRRAALVAATLVASTPAVIEVSTWAAADLGAAAFGTLAWLLLVRHWRAGGSAAAAGEWWAVGTLAGLAAACKVLALATVTAPVWAVSLLAPTPRRARSILGRLALLGAGLAVTLGPWAIRNLVASGDPLYPFGAAVAARLGRTSGEAPSSVASGIVGGEAGAKTPALVATLATFHPAGDAGAIGPLYLAVLPLAFFSAVRDRRRGALLIALGAGLAVAGWAVGPPRGRYLLPALPLVAALGAAGWRHAVAAFPRRARFALATLLLVALGGSAVSAASPLAMRRLACTLRTADGEELMRRYVSYWAAIRPINTTLPGDARLLLVGESRPYLLDRHLLVEDPFRKPLLVELAEAASSHLDIATALHQRGVTHLLVNHQEGDRIAAMNGRQSFLETRDEAAARRLATFMTACLTPAITAPPVEVWALAECRP